MTGYAARLLRMSTARLASRTASLGSPRSSVTASTVRPEPIDHEETVEVTSPASPAAAPSTDADAATRRPWRDARTDPAARARPVTAESTQGSPRSPITARVAVSSPAPVDQVRAGARLDASLVAAEALAPVQQVVTTPGVSPAAAALPSWMAEHDVDPLATLATSEPMQRVLGDVRRQVAKPVVVSAPPAPSGYTDERAVAAPERDETLSLAIGNIVVTVEEPAAMSRQSHPAPAPRDARQAPLSRHYLRGG